MVERDNRTEHRPEDDQNVISVIDHLFDIEEDTVEDLRNSFQYLSQHQSPEGCRENGHRPLVMNGTLLSITTETREETRCGNLSDNESLVEEELGPGTTLGSPLNRSSNQTSGLYTKFDNFMEDDISDLSSLSDAEEDPAIGLNNTPMEHVHKELMLSHYTDSLENGEVKSDYCSDVVKDSFAPQNVTDSAASFSVSYVNSVQETDPLPGEATISDQQDFESPFKPLLTDMNKELLKDNIVDEDLPCRETLVEPFLLDDQFDYDNVTCTPKWDPSLFQSIQRQADLHKADAE